MRSVPEWQGRTDDSPIPPRVKLRVFDRYDGKCSGCGQKVIKAEYDHTIALINGGEHRENNLRLLCHRCHLGKTKEDLAVKKKLVRVRTKNILGKRGRGWNKRYKRKVSGEVVPR